MSHWTDHRKDSNVTAMYDVHIQWTTVINSTRNHTWNNWRCGAMSVRVPVCMLVRRSWCPRWSQVGPTVRGLDKRWGAMVTFKLATLALSPTLLGPFVTWSDLAETSSTTHQIEIAYSTRVMVGRKEHQKGSKGQPRPHRDFLTACLCFEWKWFRGTGGALIRQVFFELKPCSKQRLSTENYAPLTHMERHICEHCELLFASICLCVRNSK